jgi:hypothetical protein
LHLATESRACVRLEQAWPLPRSSVMKRCVKFLREERGNVVYGYLVVTFCMILIATAVVGLGVPLAIENTHSERVLIENTP